MIELLAVIAIIAVLATVAGVFAMNYIATSKKVADQRTLEVLNDALTRYKCEGGNVRALTAGAPIGNVITRLKTPVSWTGLQHQFLQTSFTVPARSVSSWGNGSSFQFSRFNTYLAGTDNVSGTNYSNSQNLVINGCGTMQNNTNFTSFAYDGNQTHAGDGSFLINVAQQAKFSDALIPVDITKSYYHSVWAMSGDAGGANYNAANIQYVGVACYDADGLRIDAQSSAKYPGSTDTTLAAQLNTGDTTMTLTNAAGWYSGSSSWHRHFTWWPYTNSQGYSYPNYTYSRKRSNDYGSYVSVGTWTAGGISGNVITFTAPWSGPTLPAGTPIRNNYGGSAYLYDCVAGSIPNTWTHYQATINPCLNDGIDSATRFRAGTVSVKMLFYINYHGAADNTVRVADVFFMKTN